MAKQPHKTEISEVMAELLAADVAYQLGVIAKAQHRIACALASEHREDVLKLLAGFGISEQAAGAYINEPMSSEDLKKLTAALEDIRSWKGALNEKVRSIAVAEKR